MICKTLKNTRGVHFLKGTLWRSLLKYEEIFYNQPFIYLCFNHCFLCRRGQTCGMFCSLIGWKLVTQSFFFLHFYWNKTGFELIYLKEQSLGSAGRERKITSVNHHTLLPSLWCSWLRWWGNRRGSTRLAIGCRGDSIKSLSWGDLHSRQSFSR